MIRAGDRRAVSSAISYTLIAAIALALTAGLVVGTDSLISEQRDRAVRDQLEVVGQQFASTVQTVDRMSATQNAPGTAAVTRRFPGEVAGSQYRIRTVQNGGGHVMVYLEARQADVNVTVQVTVSHASTLEETSVNGGAIRVSYDAGPDTVRVSHA